MTRHRYIKKKKYVINFNYKNLVTGFSKTPSLRQPWLVAVWSVVLNIRPAIKISQLFLFLLYTYQNWCYYIPNGLRSITGIKHPRVFVRRHLLYISLYAFECLAIFGRGIKHYRNKNELWGLIKKKKNFKNIKRCSNSFRSFKCVWKIPH